MPREIEALKGFCARGGNLVLLGDNRIGFGEEPLSSALGGPRDWEDAVFACGKGKAAMIESQFADDATLTAALEDAGLVSCRLANGDPDLLLNVTYQPIRDPRFGRTLTGSRSAAPAPGRRFTAKDFDYPYFKLTPLNNNLLALHLVNYSDKARENVGIVLPEAVMSAFPHAGILVPGSVAQEAVFLEVGGGKGVTVPRAGMYTVILLCPEKADLDRQLAKEREAWPDGKPIAEPLAADAIPQAPFSPAQVNISAGRRASYLVDIHESPRHGFGGRFVYPLKAKPGEPFSVAYDFVIHHIWGNCKVYEVGLELTEVESKKTIRVALEELEGKEQSEIKKTLAEKPLLINVSLPSAGRWQAYWCYRPVHPVFDGPVGRRTSHGMDQHYGDAKKYLLNGEPRVAIPYRARIERFVVTVE